MGVSPYTSFSAIPNWALRGYSLRTAVWLSLGKKKTESRSADYVQSAIGNTSINIRGGFPLHQIVIYKNWGVTWKFFKKGIAAARSGVVDTASLIVRHQIVTVRINDLNFRQVPVCWGRNNFNLSSPVQELRGTFPYIQIQNFNLEALYLRICGQIGSKWRYPSTIGRNGLFFHLDPLIAGNTGIRDASGGREPSRIPYRALYGCLFFLIGISLGYFCICKPDFCPNAYLSIALCWIAFLCGAYGASQILQYFGN